MLQRFSSGFIIQTRSEMTVNTYCISVTHCASEHLVSLHSVCVLYISRYGLNEPFISTSSLYTWRTSTTASLTSVINQLMSEQDDFNVLSFSLPPPSTLIVHIRNAKWQ